MNHDVVSGSAGFIGTLLTRELQRIQPETRVTGFDCAGGADHLLNARDEAAVEPLIKSADVCYHLAAMADVEACDADPPAAIRNNVEATATISRLCARHDTRLVFTTTQAAETDSVYGQTKAAAEALLDIYPGLDWAALRFSNIYGRYDGRHKSTVVDAFMSMARDGDAITVDEPGTQQRNFLHVADATDALVAARHSGTGIIPVGGPDTLTINKVAKLVADAADTGSDVTLVESDREPTIIDRSVDLSIAAEKLDWRPRHSLSEYVNRWL